MQDRTATNTLQNVNENIVTQCGCKYNKIYIYTVFHKKTPALIFTVTMLILNQF